MDTEKRSPTAYIEAASEKVDRVLGGSRIVQTGQSLTAWAADVIRESYLYRWLTKEPEPEVIVIDLRETYTVGPFIRLIDKLVPHIERAWQNSVIGTLTITIAVTVIESVKELPGYEQAVALLEPPEPPGPDKDAEHADDTSRE